MKPLSLQDLKPETGSFHLSIPDRIFTLNKVSLTEETWMEKNFGSEMKQIFAEVRMDRLLPLVFLLLSPSDKAFLMEREVEDYDESGRKISRKIGGVELLKTYVSGLTDKLEIFRALMQTVGVSRPVQEELSKEGEKKSQMNPGSVGEQSSTDSLPNTDGPTTISGP